MPGRNCKRRSPPSNSSNFSLERSTSSVSPSSYSTLCFLPLRPPTVPSYHSDSAGHHTRTRRPSKSSVVGPPGLDTAAAVGAVAVTLPAFAPAAAAADEGDRLAAAALPAERRAEPGFGVEASAGGFCFATAGDAVVDRVCLAGAEAPSFSPSLQSPVAVPFTTAGAGLRRALLAAGLADAEAFSLPPLPAVGLAAKNVEMARWPDGADAVRLGAMGLGHWNSTVAVANGRGFAVETVSVSLTGSGAGLFKWYFEHLPSN